MLCYRLLFFLSLFLQIYLFGEDLAKATKHRILYLMQIGEVKQGIELYQQLIKKHQKQDFSLLEEMGYILLRLGAKQNDEASQLLSMYGANIAGTLESMEIYKMGMESPNLQTQLATIGFLNQIQDDRAEQLLLKSFSSPFLIIRMEGAYALALRRSHFATGLIDSLMQKLPPFMHVYFPELFAMIGTSDATAILQKLIASPILNVRLASYLAAAKFGRDDFLKQIRSSLTHLDLAEQESCAAAIGYLKDSHSISSLIKLSQSKALNVKLAASLSLVKLGKLKYKYWIIEEAKHKNPFAISLLVDIPNSLELLSKLVVDYNFQTRINAALTLLKKRDIRCLPTLIQMLIKDERDLGFEPIYSLGHSLTAWKVIFSSEHYEKKMKRDIHRLTLSLKESILTEALELPETAFLSIAETIFEKREHALIPLLIHLLENLKTPKAIALLEKACQKMGSPFIRTYAHLALYRLGFKHPHQEVIFHWIEAQKGEEMIRFRPLLSWTEKNDKTSFQLTPEETSRLLIEAYLTLASQYEDKGIHILLNALMDGNKKNRYVLAGLLLKSIQ